jgi:hypothetical protein
MLRFTWPARVVGLSMVALALAGCATLRVNSYVEERGADFARYRSYAWAEREAFSTGDPRLDNNRFFSQPSRRPLTCSCRRADSRRPALVPQTS